MADRRTDRGTDRPSDRKHFKTGLDVSFGVDGVDAMAERVTFDTPTEIVATPSEKYTPNLTPSQIIV